MKKIFFSLVVFSVIGYLPAFSFGGDQEEIPIITPVINPDVAIRKTEANKDEKGLEHKKQKKKKGKKVSTKEHDIDNDQDPDGENVILYLDRKESDDNKDTEGD